MIKSTKASSSIKTFLLLLTNSPYAHVKDLPGNLVPSGKLFADDTTSFLTVADANASRVVLSKAFKKNIKIVTLLENAVQPVATPGSWRFCL